jgi:hypothetical protein
MIDNFEHYLPYRAELDAFLNHSGNRSYPWGDLDLLIQDSAIRPVKAGVGFSGRIRFENLADPELSVLLEALQLPDGCAPRLGMGSHRKMFEWS